MKHCLCHNCNHPCAHLCQTHKSQKGSGKKGRDVAHMCHFSHKPHGKLCCGGEDLIYGGVKSPRESFSTAERRRRRKDSRKCSSQSGERRRRKSSSSASRLEPRRPSSVPPAPTAPENQEDGQDVSPCLLRNRTGSERSISSLPSTSSAAEVYIARGALTDESDVETDVEGTRSEVHSNLASRSGAMSSGLRSLVSCLVPGISYSKRKAQHRHHHRRKPHIHHHIYNQENHGRTANGDENKNPAVAVRKGPEIEVFLPPPPSECSSDKCHSNRSLKRRGLSTSPSDVMSHNSLCSSQSSVSGTERQKTESCQDSSPRCNNSRNHNNRRHHHHHHHHHHNNNRHNNLINNRNKPRKVPIEKTARSPDLKAPAPTVPVRGNSSGKPSRLAPETKSSKCGCQSSLKPSSRSLTPADPFCPKNSCSTRNFPSEIDESSLFKPSFSSSFLPTTEETTTDLFYHKVDAHNHLGDKLASPWIPSNFNGATRADSRVTNGSPTDLSNSSSLFTPDTRRRKGKAPRPPRSPGSSTPSMGSLNHAEYGKKKSVKSRPAPTPPLLKALLTRSMSEQRQLNVKNLLNAAPSFRSAVDLNLQLKRQPELQADETAAKPKVINLEEGNEKEPQALPELDVFGCPPFDLLPQSILELMGVSLHPPPSPNSLLISYHHESRDASAQVPSFPETETANATEGDDEDGQTESGSDGGGEDEDGSDDSDTDDDTDDTVNFECEVS